MGRELPKGWTQASLGTLCLDISSGFASGRHNKDACGIPHLRPMNIDPDGNIDLSDLKYVEVESFDALREGDVLFNNTNSPVWLGKTALIRNNMSAAYSNHMTRLRFNDCLIETAWVARCLHHIFWTGFFRANCANHVNQASISRTVLSQKVDIPLPPLNEQKRIVAKIEELFSDLDAGVETLKQIQALIKRYRQSVLKAAFEGKLTEEWRERNKAKLEPASVLLERIRLKRLQLVKNGEMRKARERPQPVSCDDLKGLPEQWMWGQIEKFSALEDNAIVDGPFGSNLKLTDYSDDGIYPVISISNIDKGYDLNSLRKITEAKYQELKRSTIRSGDILVAKIGSSYGKVGIYPSDMPDGIIPANLLKVTVNREMSWRYLLYYLKSLTFKKFLDSIVQYTAQPAFNVSKFKLLPIPTPSVPEQRQIVEEIETRFSVADKIEEIVEQSLKQSQRLRQSILKRAFEGKLVPQDPRDEPAEKLLERIREEKRSNNKLPARKRK